LFVKLFGKLNIFKITTQQVIQLTGVLAPEG